MGTDKARLLLNGRTLLELQAEKLRSLGAEEILVSGADALPGTRSVPDRFPLCGPLAGLEACLRAARGGVCLVLGVDTPLVPAALLRELLRVQRETGCGAAVAEHAGLPEPLIGVYRTALAGTAESLLRQGRCRMRDLLDRAGARLVPYTGDERLLLNCNCPEDYERLLCLAARDGSAGQAGT